ncbi:unnamed protein product [Vicia faba]|uniref:Uncharacterized protein n=1 Tax=Vicia faba TaxID=3906 RepID=A0AAV0Z6C0_VICFA|nr:unnamed protein product [Vicia faba]
MWLHSYEAKEISTNILILFSQKLSSNQHKEKQRNQKRSLRELNEREQIAFQRHQVMMDFPPLTMTLPDECKAFVMKHTTLVANTSNFLSVEPPLISRPFDHAYGSCLEEDDISNITQINNWPFASAKESSSQVSSIRYIPAKPAFIRFRHPIVSI